MVVRGGRRMRRVVSHYSVYFMNVASLRKGPCMVPVGFNCRSKIVCLRSNPANDDVSVLAEGGHIYVAFDMSRRLMFRRPGITYDCQVQTGDIVYEKHIGFVRSPRRGHRTLGVLVHRCDDQRFICSSPTIGGIGV